MSDVLVALVARVRGLDLELARELESALAAARGTCCYETHDSLQLCPIEGGVAS